MSIRRVVCPGSGTNATHYPSGKNPKVTCFRCEKRVGVMHSGKLRKHMYTTKV